jgi:signal transduction histidine kinase
MCVPLICQHELVGLIHLDSHAASGVFTDKDLELFGAIAGQAAVAIKNALLADQVHDVAMQERKRLSRLVRDLPEGVVLLDATRRVAFLNPRAEQLLPLLCDPTAPIERLGALRIDELLARSEGSEIVLPGPPQRVLALRASESAGPDGGETVVLVREVTDEREQHARSAQQQRLALIGQLAGGVAHDFSNLLAVISNFASFAREAAAEPAVREDIAEVERAADRATELVRQLLAFSRRDLVRPRVVLFEQVIAQFEKLLRRSLRADIALEMRLAQDPFRVKIDPSKLEQVLLNLAVNARDAMPSGGKFVIETSRVDLGESEAAAYAVPKGRYVLLSVSDTGTGMDPEVAARVFEPFFTTKEPGKGTGLGLASVYGIVSQAGGSVSVRSRRGEGATFLILLPETHDLLDGEAHSPSLQAGGDATVLVAEDEVAVRELTRRILSDAGYRVLEAANGDSALDVATRHGAKIDLLLTDLVMPGTGGKQLAKRLNERSPGTRVLFMSGYFDESVAADPDGGDFLAKPFTRAQLLARVRASLERTV